MASLGDYILDRTESLDKDLILDYFVEKNSEKIDRLLDKEQYLLEASRGVGKTMLMKAAMLKAEKKFPKDSVLPVWVSFEESIRLERIEGLTENSDPFLQWTMGKILLDTFNKIKSLAPRDISRLSSKLARLYGKEEKADYKSLILILNRYIQKLETGDIQSDSDMLDSIPSIDIKNILDNPTSFKKYLLELIGELKIKRIVFFFDEAAHVFSHDQQEKFFTFFKTLRCPEIACKVSVYPGITNYGKYFERGQDAKELKLEWDATNTSDVTYIINIIKSRLLAFDESYWAKISVDKDVLSIISICSNGNPRFAFHILDEIEGKNYFKSNVTVSQVISSVRTVYEKKWIEFKTLKNRLVRYKDYIDDAEDLVKKIIVPNLKVWNEKRRQSDKKLSMGFIITTDAFESMENVFSILDYSNMINIDYSRKSSGHGVHSYYISINPSAIFSDLIIKGFSEFKNISVAIENNQSYSVSTDFVIKLSSRVISFNEFHCSNSSCGFITNDEDVNFCSKCGNPIAKKEPVSLYKILRSHEISNLAISSKILKRLGQKFKTIGELYDADLDDILEIKYIGNVRATNAKSVSIEYMAG